ncbi:class I SAM-dependent methyltransferase [Candidatus Pelagibacter sp. Uisw_090]|uniref:class I SAM-dependent methyltransferase n=1 Tax=Candidatus Pelagibacter sp. Uisw_090 TaxID=3230993 RepID=UPI0039E8F384
MNCRHCKIKMKLELIDLGSSPPSNAYLTKETLSAPEKWFPLRVLVCENCWLVQTEDFTKADDLFDKDYAYFSSFSTSLLKHTKQFVKDSVKRFSLDENSHLIEVAANDGYLLQYVMESNIPCIGIEPTTSTANAARAKGIDIIEEFFGVKLAEQLTKKGKQADFTVANNVLAHVPDINDFVSGFSIILKPNGVSTFEFTHLLKIVNKNLFDTIYHEHFSYLSLTALETIFKENGLQIFDLEELTTQGGSLRLFAQRSDTGVRKISKKVIELRKQEAEAGINDPNFYKGFQLQTNIIKDELLVFLIKAKQDNKKVVAYGAAAKGNTLLNYAGVRPDLITYVVDKNLEKQNKYMPGSRIPIRDEDFLKNDKPDFVLILPWNLKNEIITQLEYIKNSGGKFVIAVPKLEVI